MAYISNEIINEIRNKTDIVDVVSKYVSLTKKGKNYIGVCPFHDDHSPSMSVSPEKQIFTCFSCGASGNVFTFVSDFEKIPFAQAVALLGERVGVNVSGTISKETKKDDYFNIYELANKFYQNSLFTSLGKNAMAYLEGRNIDKETIKKFGIGLSIQKISLTDYLVNKKYSTEKLIEVGLTNDNGNDVFINRIMFPIYDLSGNPVAFSARIYNTRDTSKYVNTKETDKFKKGKILYNYHIAKEHLKKNDTVIIMEGQMDVIRASTVGINNCIATMGTALTKDHRNIIKNMTNNIILCFDGDAAGEKATISAIEILEDTDVNIKVVRLPNNMDPDEYIVREGKDSFLYQLNSAISLIDYKMELLKKNKDFTDVKDVSSYINSAIKELTLEKDDIVVELNLKKLATSFNVDYDTVLSKYNNLKKKEENIVNEGIKPKKVYDRYRTAENNLIYYMLIDNRVLNMVEKRVGYFPTKNIRELSNEIIYYFHKYGIISIADFISYIASNEELLTTLKDILAMDRKESFQIDEIEDYIFVINEYYKEKRITDLTKKMKEEKEPLKQAKILEEIMEIRGVRKDDIRN
ncbi:MAG: DNA primase [Bacilli bacterium]